DADDIFPVERHERARWLWWGRRRNGWRRRLHARCCNGRRCDGRPCRYGRRRRRRNGFRDGWRRSRLHCGRRRRLRLLAKLLLQLIDRPFLTVERVFERAYTPSETALRDE